MKKETLTLTNIAKDLEAVAKNQLKITTERILYPVIPALLAFVILILLMKNLWVILLIALVAVRITYGVVRYIIEYRKFDVKKKAIRNAVDRADVCISVEKFSHRAAETVYEPHYFGAKRKLIKPVPYFYFTSGSKWRIHNANKHYSWSKEYHISAKGLQNISLCGDEFYFVSLPFDPNVSYVYPCKYFQLDQNLIKNNTDE